MNHLLSLLQLLVIGTAIGYFACMSLVSITFFIVADQGAAKGKRAISIAAGSMSILVSWLLLTRPSDSTQMLAIALPLYVYALSMFLWAWRSNRSKPFDFIFSTREPTRIAEAGPYRWVRHPFYSSYCACWIASIAGTMNPIVAIIGTALVGTYVYTAFREECHFAQSPLASAYRTYSARTGRLLPRVWPR